MSAGEVARAAGGRLKEGAASMHDIEAAVRAVHEQNGVSISPATLQRC